MTEQEAMIRLDFIRGALLGETKPEIIPNENNVELMDNAIKALEDVQQYRTIGTVEECRAAVEIIRYMIQEGIEPEVLEAYVWFENELVKKGFTVKSVLEAREKQIAAKPLGGKDIEGNEYAICRECSAILSDCQTADYLGRFPQIISDGNTCHSLRSMRQKHIISGVTADYRGLISVQLWLD